MLVVRRARVVVRRVARMEADPGHASLVDEPPRQLHAVALAGLEPGRSFTVTGSPLPSDAARAIATALSASSSRAAPAPVLQTFLTGQPMLRSIRSAPASAVAAASASRPGSWPNSWIETGCSSGWIRRNSLTVRSLP